MNDLINIKQFIKYLDEIAKREPVSEELRERVTKRNELYIYNYITDEDITIIVVEYDPKKINKWQSLFQINVSVSGWGQTEREFVTNSEFSISDIETYLIEENLIEIAKVISGFRLWLLDKNLLMYEKL